MNRTSTAASRAKQAGRTAAAALAVGLAVLGSGPGVGAAGLLSAPGGGALPLPAAGPCTTGPNPVILGASGRGDQIPQGARPALGDAGSRSASGSSPIEPDPAGGGCGCSSATAPPCFLVGPRQQAEPSDALLPASDADATAVTGSGRVVAASRAVRDVHEVDLSTVGTLTISQGNAESLTVTAEDNILPLLTTEVRNGRLTIGSRGAFSTTKPIAYALTVKELRVIALSGSGQIEIPRFTAKRLRLVASGSGDLELNGLTATDLEVALPGSGGVTVAGAVTSQEVTLDGAGSYDAAQLASREATITASGSGDAAVQVSDRLEARVRGSGNVEYTGDPVVHQEISGSGSVERAG